MRASERTIILALDVPTIEQALDLVDRVSPVITFFKIGLELLFCGGLDLARTLKQRDLRIMIDAKLHDIPRTVNRATAQISAIGADFITVHATPGTVPAAVKACHDTCTKILAVTVLTSQALDVTPKDHVSMPAQSQHGDDCPEQETHREQLALRVEKLARDALDDGAKGCVVSPWELARVRGSFPDALLVTPGIRPYGYSWGDQRRVATPAQAWRDGADYLVIGRPIVAAADPLQAAIAIQGELRRAQDLLS